MDWIWETREREVKDGLSNWNSKDATYRMGRLQEQCCFGYTKFEINLNIKSKMSNVQILDF